MLEGGHVGKRGLFFLFINTTNLGVPSSSKEAETGKLKKSGSHRLDFKLQVIGYSQT